MDYKHLLVKILRLFYACFLLPSKLKVIDNMHFFQKKVLVISFILLFPLQIASAEADLYSLIYNEVSAYNGNYQEADWISQAILYASNQYGVDPLLVTAIMEQESKFNFNVISSCGAIGLMQLMPDTAAMLGVNPYNPLDNVIGGVSYLRTQLDNFSNYGDYATTVAVAAYNAGPQAVIKYGGVPPYRQTQNYVISISAIYNRLISAR